jgi:hypothetical protein
MTPRTGKLTLGERRHCVLMRRVAAGMQEADGDRLDPRHSQQSNPAVHFVRIERAQHRAVAADPLVDRRGQRSLSMRFGAALRGSSTSAIQSWVIGSSADADAHPST